MTEWPDLSQAILLALFSFGAQLLLLFLRGGGSVDIRLVQNPAQNSLMNYEVRNIGSVVVEDVHVEFSRDAHGGDELWNTEARRDLKFTRLTPGETHVSMFCLASKWENREPVTATVRYRNGRMFRRLADIDEDQWWQRLVRLPLWRIRRRQSFTLDPTSFFAFRYNVGFAGKDELSGIADSLKKMKNLQEKSSTRRELVRIAQAVDTVDCQRDSRPSSSLDSSAWNRVVALMPDLLYDMKNDLHDHPLGRTFIFGNGIYTPDSSGKAVFQYRGHENIADKVAILIHHGLVQIDYSYSSSNITHYTMRQSLVANLSALAPRDAGREMAESESTPAANE